jgi:hypothetical protein
VRGRVPLGGTLDVRSSFPELSLERFDSGFRLFGAGIINGELERLWMSACSSVFLQAINVLPSRDGGDIDRLL